MTSTPPFGRHKDGGDELDEFSHTFELSTYINNDIFVKKQYKTYKNKNIDSTIYINYMIINNY